MRKDLNFYKIVQGGLIVGSIGFLLIAYYLIKASGAFTDDPELASIMLIVSNVIAPICIVAGLLIFRNKIKGIVFVYEAVICIILLLFFYPTVARISKEISHDMRKPTN